MTQKKTTKKTPGIKTLDQYAKLAAEVKIKDVTTADLRILCEKEGITDTAMRRTMIAALDLLAARKVENATVVVGRYAGKATRCGICGYPVMVNGTRRDEMPDGRSMITRSMKCLGPGNHRFPLKEITNPAVSIDQPDEIADDPDDADQTVQEEN